MKVQSIIVTSLITTCLALKSVRRMKSYQLTGNHEYRVNSRSPVAVGYIALEDFNCRITSTSNINIDPNRGRLSNRRVMIHGLQRIEFSCYDNGPDQEGVLRIYQRVFDDITVSCIQTIQSVNTRQVTFNWHYFDMQEFELNYQLFAVEFDQPVKAGYMILDRMSCALYSLQISEIFSDFTPEHLMQSQPDQILTQYTILEILKQQIRIFLGDVKKFQLLCRYGEEPGSMNIYIHSDYPRTIKVTTVYEVPVAFEANHAIV